MKTDPKKLRLKSGLVLTILLLVGVIAILAMLISDQEQDACSFGPVTNAQYRELKKAIAARIDEPQLGFVESKMEPKVAKAFLEFVGTRADIYEKIAAAHALLRIWGAQYRNTNGLSDDHPFALTDDPNKFFVTQIYYRPQTNPIYFLLSMGQGWRIFVRIASPNAEKDREGSVPVQRGTFRVSVSLPSVLLDGWKIPSAVESCPPVPRPQDAQSFASK